MMGMGCWRDFTVWVTEANGRRRGERWVYSLRHWVFPAARLECRLAAGSRPSKRKMSDVIRVC